MRDPFKLGDDIDAVSRATITMSSAVRAIRNSARRIARQFIAPPDVNERRRARSSIVALVLARSLRSVVAGATRTPSPRRSLRPSGRLGFRRRGRSRSAPGATTSARRRSTSPPSAAFLTLAFVSFFRKSVRLKYVTLVIAVAYLGISKSQLISIVNVFGLFGGNLPLFRYNLAWYLFAIVTVVSTVLWGRVYCGRLCAFGALTQLVDAIVPARWRVQRAARRRAARRPGSSTASSPPRSPTSS